MPNRADMLCPPENLFKRAAWLDLHRDHFLSQISLEHAPLGWTCMSAIERRIFPVAPLASQWLGGQLDPVCPTCGVETEEGTAERIEPQIFLLKYGTCGHEVRMNAIELAARVDRGRAA